MKEILDYIKWYKYLSPDMILRISYLAYGIGFAFQVLCLSYFLWWNALNYLSLEYSIILFIILLVSFWAAIWSLVIVPLWLVVMLINWIYSLDTLLQVCIIFWIIISWIIGYFIYRSHGDKLMEKYKSKIYETLNFITKGIIILFFISLTYWALSSKTVELQTSLEYKDGKILWKQLFYNNDYYFMYVCGETLIIPSHEVKKVSIKADKFQETQMNWSEKQKLESERRAYCSND